MTMASLAMINGSTNLCENVVLDDRPIDEIPIPAPYFLLDVATTPTLIWRTDTTGTLVQLASMGDGGIGYAWNGTTLIQPYPL